MLEVIEQLAAAARHLQESAAGVEVLPVGAEMLGQVVDARCQEGDLLFTAPTEQPISRATCTSLEPVSFSWVLYSAMISGLATVGIVM